MTPLSTPQYRALRSVLIEARCRAGLTQRQLAARVKRPQSWVAKMEVGDRHISVEDMLLVARGLRIRPLRLFLAFVRKCEELERIRAAIRHCRGRRKRPRSTASGWLVLLASYRANNG
jgi:transcriptional regulator with XRE-family HTH domain